MNRRLFSIALGLVVCAGCGDTGGNRRQASGSAAGAGLVGSDINALAAGPAQSTTAPAPPAGMAGQPPAVPGTPANQPAAAPAAGQPSPPLPAAGAPQTSGSLPGLPGVTLPGQLQPGAVVSEKAQAGMTGKGNYGPGAVTTPISVYFQAQERLILLQVDQALNLYQADRGSKPKTEEEFMKQIIEANRIRLPQLPPGSKYKYDPQKGELQVEHPQ